MTFTRTLLLAGLQCEKQLAAFASTGTGTAARIPAGLNGRVVERQARELFPGIVQVSRDALGNTLVVQTATLPGTVVWLDPCRAGYGRAGSAAQ